MKNTSRSIRRHHYYRMKAKWTNYWKFRGFGRWSAEGNVGPTEHWVGNMVSIHGCGCSRPLCCGNPREYYGSTVAERKQAGYWPEFDIYSDMC